MEGIYRDNLEVQLQLGYYSNQSMNIHLKEISEGGKE